MNRLLFVLALTTTAVVAVAQPFGIVAQIGANTTALSPGGTLQIPAAAIGSATLVNFTITYRGTTGATVTGVTGTGSGDYKFTGAQVPLQLQPGAAVTTSATYTPTTGQAAQAQISVTYTEGTSTTPTTFVINLNGTAPDLIFSYAFSGGNAQAISDGATIQYPSTAVNTTRATNITVLNRGSGPGTINNISLTGDAFQLGGLQLPPFNVPAAGSLSFTATFAPLDRNLQTGTLLIATPNATLSFNLQGTGTAAAWTYTILGTTNTDVQPGQTVSFPDTNVGSTSKLTIQIANNGNGPGTITNLNIAGAGYSISSQPFLPATVAVGSTTQIVVNFLPADPGPIPGALKIGDDTFTLAGKGNGPHLTYNYSIGGSVTAVTAGGTIQFSPSKIGQGNSLTFTVTNDGNASTSVNTIFLTGNAAFKLDSLPALPLNLAAGATSTFTINFNPTATGVTTATLQVGAAGFNINGSAVAPDPLPGITLSGPSGATTPRQQLTYTLKLAQPYSIDVVGTLNLQFSSAVFTNDPTVQFATGGTSVQFGIAAGTTTAVFPNNTQQISLQTGTVAGNITLFPTFSTLTGLDITPPTIPGLSLTIAQSAPSITALSISGQSSTGFTLNISGYATSRSVTQIGLTFTGASGTTVNNATATIAADSAFQAWYQTAGSQAAGSAFTATVPITLSGNSATPSNLLQTLQSVSVTLTNAQGTSSSQLVNIQ